MKKKFLYSVLLAAFSVAIFCGCTREKKAVQVKIPRMNPKYGYKDKEPMGSYIAHHYIGSLFDNGFLTVTNKPFNDLKYTLDYNKTVYIIVSKSVFLSRRDVESMMNYVSSGNTLFISAEYIDRKLVDTLEAELDFDISSLFPVDEFTILKKDTWLSLSQKKGDTEKKYGIFFVPFVNRFSDFDSTATQVLGYNEGNDANFISIDHGQGKFVLHTAPAAFSNYFLLTGNNKEYLENVFSYFDYSTSYVYWDNYYRLRIRDDNKSFSIVEFLQKHPSLFYAFMMVIAALLLFVAFGGKRRQRIMPEKNPNVNTTVSYTETIGRLYLQKKDNRNIALKMFTYFLEHVRNHYYLNTTLLNNEFAGSLSRKSGVPEAKVKQLLQLMDDTERSDNISDIRLLELHNLLQEYHKK